MAPGLSQISPIVSVVMSVYNGESFLKEAIDSVLNQTFTDFELIIVNDGSTDNSSSIINSYTDSRIKQINNEGNRGLIYSLNRGIEEAKGKYIARMDADDICLRNRLELQVKYLESNKDTVVVGSDYYLLNGSKIKYIKNKNDSDYQKSLLIFTPCFCHPTVMMKNIFIEKQLSYNKYFVHAEDYKLWTELAQHGSFSNISTPLIKYRHHAKQTSNQQNDKQLQISSDIRKAYFHQLKFQLNERQLEIVNIIGNNTFIREIKILAEVEDCLFYLEEQNRLTQAFNQASFSEFLFKFWIDTCGNTSLGYKAYSKFHSSALSKKSILTLKQHVLLIVKCFVRKFN